jgi:hypothetical protein
VDVDNSEMLLLGYEDVALRTKAWKDLSVTEFSMNLYIFDVILRLGPHHQLP